MPQTQTPLALWLQERAMKQTELAARLGVSDATVSLVTSGTRDASGNFFRRFAEVFTYPVAVSVLGLLAARPAEETTAALSDAPDVAIPEPCAAGGALMLSADAAQATLEVLASVTP